MKYFFLIIFAFLWYLGFSKDLAHWLFEKNITKDDYRYGDLYRLSNLAQFRVPVDKCIPTKPPKNANTSLFLMGDSFTEKERIDSSHFVAQDFKRFFIGDTISTQLNKSQKNILIIETVERHFRERFSKPYRNLQIISTLPRSLSVAEGRGSGLFAYEVPYNTERHESILFSSDMFLKIKEWKAWLNWKAFGRIDQKVVLSKNGKHILYYLDAQSSGITSCFDKISEEEIQNLVQNANTTYQEYKKLGFDEVYLSIIPNKTSILASDLGEYNHLIERIQQNKNLKMPFIDIYSTFKNPKEPNYDIGDTHWNCRGKQIWIDAVNHKL